MAAADEEMYSEQYELAAEEVQPEIDKKDREIKVFKKRIKIYNIHGIDTSQNSNQEQILPFTSQLQKKSYHNVSMKNFN